MMMGPEKLSQKRRSQAGNKAEVHIKDYYTNKDYVLWRLLEQTRNAIRKARQKELGKNHITARQAVILALAYGTNGEVTPSQIALWLVLEPHSISEAVDRMEKGGLVRKAGNPERKGSVRIKITEKGYETYCKAAKQQAFHKVFASITEEERQQLRPILKRLRDVAFREIGMSQELPFPPH